MARTSSYGPGKASLRTLAIAGAALALAMPAAATVTVIDWSYSNGTDLGSGTITATFDSGDTYTMTAITGTWDGSPITGLAVPGTCCEFPSNDNLIFTMNDGGGGGSGFLDEAGFTFTTATDTINVYFAGSGYDWLDSSSNFGGGGTFAVPEPSTWALMLVGFAGLGAALRTRRRLAVA